MRHEAYFLRYYYKQKVLDNFFFKIRIVSTEMVFFYE